MSTPKTEAERSGATDCYAPVAITCWKTEDGEVFEYKSIAEHHQESLNAAKRANEVFTSGGTVADGLRAAGFTGDIDPVLERVTAETQLVISYWQCRDTPGYKPCHFEYGLSMYVGGDAGSWSGSYGGSVPIRDLVRYAKDDRTVFGG